MRDEAVQSFASCQKALVEEEDKSEDGERRKEALNKQLVEVKGELGRKVDLVAEKVKKQSEENCQLVMQLSTTQQEMALKDLQQKQSQVGFYYCILLRFDKVTVGASRYC